MSSRAFRAVLLVGMGSAGSLAALAAEPADEGALESVLIIGRTPLPGAETAPGQIAAPAQTASARDLARSHSLDLTAFMNRMLGGVYVNDIQNNPLQPDINYRGYTASPLLGTPQGLSVFLDGVRLNQPFGDVVSWDLIPKQAIDSMTLMPGSNPLFGLNTLGGALSLRSKDGFSSPGASIGVNYGSDARRSVAAEIGGHADYGLNWYGTANRLADDGWRTDSPTRATQVFGKLGLRTQTSDAALSAAYAHTSLTGNGLQDQQLLAQDYASVYSKPDSTGNESWLVNGVMTHRLSDGLSLAANVFHRNIATATLNGDVNDESLGESLYQPSTAERAALAAAGYVGVPASGETQANTPFPSWRCIANILLNSEPNEKCNGLNNRTSTRQHDTGESVQASLRSAPGGRPNQLTIGVANLDSTAHFKQTSQFGYLTPDRGVATAAGPGAFADGTQDSENVFDARVDLLGETTTRSAFFTNTLALTPITQVTVSGRFDDTRVRNVDALTPADEAGTLTANHRFKRFNPAIGITVAPRDGLSAYLGYNEGSRAPSAIELGCADPDNPCRLPNALAGDPPLTQVITRTVETGVRGSSGNGVAWNVGIFRADNRDDILFVASGQTSFGYFTNFGRTRRQGAELGVRARLGTVGLGANYTLLDATYRTAEEVAGAGNSSNDEGAGFEGNIQIEPGDRIPLTPRHIFKAQADWEINSKLTLTADLISVSGSFARGNENNEHESDGTFYLGEGRSGGYAVVNLGGEFRPTATLSFSLQLNNLLDRRYSSAAQLGATAFNAAGDFVARPFAGPIVNGDRPLLGSTFYAPGAPRSFWMGVKFSFREKQAE